MNKYENIKSIFEILTHCTSNMFVVMRGHDEIPNDITVKNDIDILLAGQHSLPLISKELQNNGWTEEQAKQRVDRLAYELKDYFDAESGNYNRIESPILNWAQKNLLFVTTITGLPLATISNFVEFALLTKSLTWNQIFGKGGINDIGRAFVTELASIAERGAGAVTGRPTPTRRDKGGHAVARELGFFDWEVGAAHTTGVSEAGHLRQKLLDTYFKAKPEVPTKEKNDKKPAS